MVAERTAWNRARRRLVEDGAAVGMSLSGIRDEMRDAEERCFFSEPGGPVSAASTKR
jgi:hypothetical protein